MGGTGELNAADPPRKIIHVDMDCFYAAIEMRDDPTLTGKPIAVGGASDRRGVITTCSYEARRFGVRSAMATARALQLCPDLILLPVRMDAYRAESQRIQQIFHDYTDRVEPLSLDEAFLDVTGSPHCQGSATLIAQEIRERIYTETGLTASAGIAPNKFLAKIASDWNKPNGQFVIRPQDIEAFVRELPVARLFGVGPVTARKLKRMGIVTCSDLQAIELATLLREFGGFGQRLHELSHGIDDRPVHNARERKSLSVEETFAEDLPGPAAIEAELPALMEDLTRRLARAQQKQLRPIHTLFVKLKFDNFRITTMQTAGENPDAAVFRQLLQDAWHRGARPVRLVGIGLRFQTATEDASTEQLGLDLEPEPEKDER